jgi:hypothetical protein
MSNVTQFPTQELQAASLHDRLKSLIDGLEVKYSELDALHADLHASEQTATEWEAELDILLKQYVPLVGIDSVDPMFLTYSNNVKVLETEEGFQLMWLGESDEN